MKILLVAPPGLGKTSLILEFVTIFPNKIWIFLSPLRAITDEVFQRIQFLKEFKSLNIKNKNDLNLFLSRSENFNFITTTTNFFSFDTLKNLLIKNGDQIICVLDEMHLCYYWGESFRQDLLDCYYALLLHSNNFFLLTATLPIDFLKQICADLQREKCQVYYLNYGNQNYSRQKIKIISYPKKFYYLQKLVLNICILKKEKILIFVKYRRDVENLKNYLFELFNQNVQILTCVGGESKAFLEELKYVKSPQIIICTTVLSHGVNLPSVRHIFFLFKVENFDFWVQMLCRGGRKGERYYLHHQDLKALNSPDLIKSFIQGLILLLTYFKSIFIWKLKELF